MSRPFPLLIRLAFALLAAGSAAAEQIDFDDVPPANANRDALSEEYAQLGVHFAATDDGSVWSGLSQGDPGGWGLEGTAGTAFVGFNGQSYALGASFDVPVREVAVDVAAAAGALPGDSVVMRGYRAGALVEEQSVVLGDVGAWSTVSLAEEVDEVEWIGIGSSPWYPLHPFGLDNLRWTGEGSEPGELPPPESESLAVTIDVRPWSAHNPVNPFARGVIPVALLGSDALDLEEVDATSLAFGPHGAPCAHSNVVDVNRDGHTDLVCLHRVPETGIALGDTEACLSGTTADGTPFRGCDAIRTVPRHGVGRHACHARGGRNAR